MRYQLCTKMESRTPEYVGSVDWLDDEDLQALEENCRRHNEHVREVSRKHGRVIGEIYRVRRKGRGPRVRSYYHTLHENAKYWDIYYGVDTHNQHELHREIDSGLTPGELKALDKLRNAVWRMELEGKMRKRRNG